MSSTAGADSTDPSLGNSENSGKSVNSNGKSTDKDDVGLKEHRNKEDRDKSINEKETDFKSNDSVVKSEASTNPIGANKNSTNSKSSEIEIVSGNNEDGDGRNKSLADVSSAFAETSADPVKNEDSEKTMLSEDDSETSKLYKFDGEGFEGFLDISDIDYEEILKVLYDKEETEIMQLQVLTQNETSELNSPPPKRRKEGVEESDISSHCSSPALSISSQLSVLSYSKRSRTGSPASRGSRKSNVDLGNPKYLVPFEYGWKREVVTRGVTSREDGISKDVYYFHPTGKKLRSLREVSERLTPGLTIENFTFYKEALGADPKFETIRNARSLGQSPSEASTPRATPVKAKAEQTPVVQELPPSPVPNEPPKAVVAPLKNFVKTPKEVVPKPLPPPPPAKREKLVLKFNKGTPKIALKKPAAAAAAAVAINGDQAATPKPAPPKLEGPKPHPNAPAGPRRKITPRKRPAKPVNTSQEEEVLPGLVDGGGSESALIPPLWKQTAASPEPSGNEALSWSRLDENSTTEEVPQDYCTIRCTKAMGLIPTLQCSLCFCLYHHECCEPEPVTTFKPALKYICKTCQADSSDSEDTGLVKNITPEDVTCDKNPPIVSPKPIHPVTSSPATPSSPAATSTPQTHSQVSPTTTVVGGSTSWLPPNNNTVFKVPKVPKLPRHRQHKSDDSSTPPQSLVSLNSKRYIVVPKQNVTSTVTPTTSSSPSPAKAEPSQSTTIITPTPTSTIIQGPPLKNNPFIQTTGNGSGVLLVPILAGEKPNTEPSSQFLGVNPVAGSSATQTSSQPDLPIGSDTPDQFVKKVDKLSKRSTAEGVDESMQKFMRNICIGYTALLNVFQYLKVQELLRAGRVCRLWRDIASHASLWQTVRMKNSQVSDWKGFTDSLARHGTKNLDLRKMLTSPNETEETWLMFARYIANVHTLERLEMCRCSVAVLEQIIESCPNLLVLNAQLIGSKDETKETIQIINLETLAKLKNLKEIRLKSLFGIELVGSLKSFTALGSTITTLSLTSVRNLDTVEIECIGQLDNLEALELGECTDLPENFPHVVLAKLQNLKRIRLEKGPGKFSANEMLNEMSKLKELVQLELINFDIKPGFDEALAACTNIKRLLLIPTYVTQSATTNNILLSGAFKLWKTLTHFVWVVTMELLKVTELFVDQCEGKGSKKGGGNSVPVLKPVPLPEVHGSSQEDAEMAQEENVEGSKNPTPITVIPIDDLFDILKEALPNTRVKLLKIPFQNTWRQSLAEGSV